MTNYYEIYRNSYGDFGVYNDSVPYFTMLNDKYTSIREVDERNLLRDMSRMGINISSYYTHLYNPERILSYKNDNIRSFYDYFPNWYDLTSSMFSSAVAKSIPFIKIDKPFVLRTVDIKDVDLNVVKNTKNIVLTLKEMCPDDTNIDPFNMGSLLDKSVDDGLSSTRKEIFIKRLEKYLLKFILLYGYTVNTYVEGIEEEDGTVIDGQPPVDRKFTYNIFKKYYYNILSPKDITNTSGNLNLFGRLYDMRNTLLKERDTILGISDTNTLIANMSQRSFIFEPYYISSIISKLDVMGVHFFNVSVCLDYLDEELISALELIPTTVLNIQDFDTSNVKLYDSFELSVETNATEFYVEVNDENLVTCTYSVADGKINFICRNVGDIEITVKATAQDCLETVKRVKFTVNDIENDVDTHTEEETLKVISSPSNKITIEEGKMRKVAVLCTGAFVKVSEEDPEDVVKTKFDGTSFMLEIVGEKPGNATVIVGTSKMFTLSEPNDVEVRIPVEVTPKIETTEDVDPETVEEGEPTIEPIESVIWEIISPVVTEDQFNRAFFFSKRLFETYIVTNIKSVRDKNRVMTTDLYKILSGDKSNIFSPIYLHDEKLRDFVNDMTL